MQAYRHGIQRHLQKTKPNLDLVNGLSFRNSSRSFKSMTKELKRQGRAVVEHYPSISDENLNKLYTYFSSHASDIQILQYKVFVDIMLYFGRVEEVENLSQLTSQDFSVMSDASGSLYAVQTKDEKTKNHQDDSEKSADDRMYETLGSDRCSVRSLVIYIRLLNPECNKLFQQVRSQPKEECTIKWCKKNDKAVPIPSDMKNAITEKVSHCRKKTEPELIHHYESDIKFTTTIIIIQHFHCFRN